MCVHITTYDKKKNMKLTRARKYTVFYIQMFLHLSLS